ncbi:MAG: NUDIX hydrolase [Thermodesulfobacteriota bacterium]|nr:NUDIX hydrolase [Thermodesulfobacteriota bacterium]
MHHHNPQFQFCPVCGGRLNKLRLKTNEQSRLICSACDFVFYLDPKVVACSILELDGKIVLLRRDIEPQKGKWVMPGGYVDRGEEVEAAAIRETREECGLKIRINRLLGVYSYSGQLPVVIVYVAEYLSGDLIRGEETMEAKLFSDKDIPWQDLAFESTVDALKDYYDQTRHSPCAKIP